MNKFIVGLSTIGLGASLYLGTSCFNGVSRTEAMLMKHPEYVQATKLANVMSNLGSAESSLEYEPASVKIINEYDEEGNITGTHTKIEPPEYPDARSAREYIKNALSEIIDASVSEVATIPLEKYPSSVLSKDLQKPFIVLRRVRESLPDENDIKKYKGEDVDNEVFSSQREEINHSKDIVSIERDEKLSRVPVELLQKKSQYVAGMVGSGLLGIISLTTLLYGFSIRERGY